ncbi:hypothetical protein AX15_004374 [Amanita polypyramis BW_CC]|nr:hypothetical protein AX15_004374 [Amanita polypyramis BW_CC]
MQTYLTLKSPLVTPMSTSMAMAMSRSALSVPVMTSSLGQGGANGSLGQNVNGGGASAGASSYRNPNSFTTTTLTAATAMTGPSTTSTSTSTTASSSPRPASTMGPSTPRPMDPVKASVAHLLTRAYSLPCSTAAQAFTNLVQPMARFQLALDALLPLLDAGAVEVGDGGGGGRRGGVDVNGSVERVQLAELPQRILVAYILFSMYAPYPIAVNPFKSVLLVTFVRERNRAMHVVSEGGNEQLVWVLWKILRGDGNDIGPYTPSTLARSPLPSKLRASNLILDDALYNTVFDIEDNVYSYFQSQSHNQRLRSASSDPNHEKNDPRLNAVSRTVEEDRQNEKVVHGMKLLLAARERVLTLSEQRLLIPTIPDLAASQMVASLDLAPLAALNPQITHLLFVSIFNDTGKTADVTLLYPYLDTLSCLPPTRPSFDLMGRLIQDASPISLTGFSTVADLIRIEVLGRFIHECIAWLDRAEIEEREGLVSDDRYAQGVQNLCRFFSSLVKLSIVDPTSDIDSAEMAHFSLRHARFEEANMLYRVLASGRL